MNQSLVVFMDDARYLVGETAACAILPLRDQQAVPEVVVEHVALFDATARYQEDQVHLGKRLSGSFVSMDVTLGRGGFVVFVFVWVCVESYSAVRPTPSDIAAVYFNDATLLWTPRVSVWVRVFLRLFGLILFGLI